MSGKIRSAALLTAAAAAAIGMAAPPAVAAVRPAGPPAATAQASFLADFSPQQGWSPDRHLRLMADITGDGRADIVGFGEQAVYTAVAQGDGGFGPVRRVLDEMTFGQGWRTLRFNQDTTAGTNSHPRFLADITGDGRADIVGIGNAGVWTAVATGDGGFGPARFVLAAFGASGRTTVAKFALADMNTDHRADLVSISNRKVEIAAALGDGGFAAPALATTAYDLTTFDLNFFQVADVTADGRAEIMTYQGVGPIRQVFSRSRIVNLTYTDPQPTGATFPTGAIPNFRTFVDVNRSGTPDQVGFPDAASGRTGVWVARDRGDGTFDPYQQGSADFGPDQGWDGLVRRVSDITGDFTGDVVGFGFAGIYTGVGRGDGTFQPGRFVYAGFGRDQGWGGDETVHPRFVTDITGDGRADIVGFGDAGVFTATATGDGGFS